VVYGYVRTSTKEQNTDRQVLAMLDFGIETENIITEKISGANFNRPLYQGLITKLHIGDVLVIKSIDRLGRDYEEILSEWRHITKEIAADIVVLDMPLLDTRKKDNDLTGTFVADLVLQILSYVAETERNFLRQRQAEGISAARKKGIKFGRPKCQVPKDFHIIVEKWRRKNLTLNEALKQAKIGRSTFFRYLQNFQ